MNKLVHVRAACPRCKSGIMTPYSVIRQVNDVLKQDLISSMYVSKSGEFILTICSVEICGYTEMVATPSTLAEHSKVMRKRLSTHIC